MTKQQLIEQVVGTTGQSKADVESVYDAIIEKSSASLAAGEKVEMRGFGIFEAKETKAHWTESWNWRSHQNSSGPQSFLSSEQRIERALSWDAPRTRDF